MLIHRHEPDRRPKAGVRWIGRVALEHSGIALQDVRTLADALLKLDTTTPPSASRNSTPASGCTWLWACTYGRRRKDDRRAAR